MVRIVLIANKQCEVESESDSVVESGSFFSLKKISCTKVGLVLRYMYIGSWEEMGGLPQNVTQG